MLRSWPRLSDLLVFFWLPQLANGQNTKLVGSPRVQCADGSIQVSLETNEPFEGNVYAKGFFDRQHCRVSGNGARNVANITIPITDSDCGIRRLRTFEPKGITFEITVVLMLHRKFLTRNDRAFQIQCSYVELSQQYTNKIDTLDFSASADSSDVEQLQIHLRAPMPKCRYDVLSIDGKALIFATLGTSLQHRWSCESAKTDGRSESDEDAGYHQYCLTVHSCDVSDGGHGNTQKLLDVNGCPLDKSLMDSIVYQGDLEASYHGFVFKFADKPTVYFSCQIRLELKEVDGRCARTSSRCPPVATSLKSTVRSSITYDVDFPTPRTPQFKPTAQDSSDADDEETPANDSQHFGRNDVRSDEQKAQAEEAGESKDEQSEVASSDPPFASHDGHLLDIPLPTLTIENPGRHRLTATTDSPSTDDPSTTKRTFGRASIEMDVNAMGIDVVDVSEGVAFDEDGVLLAPRVAPRSIEVSTSRQQICISRAVLSTSVLSAAAVLLMIAVLFCSVLWRFVRRPRFLIVSPNSSIDRAQQRLSAFSA